MLRRDFIKLMGSGVAAAAIGGCSLPSASRRSAQNNKPRPNILLIVADDLGYGDIGCFAEDGEMSPQEEKSGVRLPVIKTPNIDALAANGLKLTNFYANGPVCSPTRAALLTGRYQHRSGVVNVLGQTGVAFAQVYPDREPFEGLSSDELTIAKVLQSGGYRTACIGKWHLGPFYRQDGKYHPLDYGFDYFTGPSGNAGDNFSMEQDGVSYFWRNRDNVKAPGYYFTDVLADEAIGFINSGEDKPFFVYLPFTAPHAPLVGLKDKDAANAWDEKSNHFRTDFGRAYKEVVEALDSSIGRICRALKDSGLEKDTLIIFTSDNGQTGFGRPPHNRHQGKQTVYEGGIHVPAIIKWTGEIAPGQVSDRLTATMDIFPTLAAVSKAPLPAQAKPLDGIDISPLFAGDLDLSDRMMYWEAPYQVWMENFANRIWAVRWGKWKLLQSHINRPLELYDLEADKTETNNLADQNPRIVAKLKAAFEKWKKDVYSECPYDLDDFIAWLTKNGIITEKTTNMAKDGY